MRDIFTKVDISPADLGSAVTALYREAANHSLKTLWQRALLVSGVPREAPATKLGLAVAAQLDRQEGGQIAANAAAPDASTSLMATMRAAARRHLTETRALNADLRQRRQVDAVAQRAQQPGLWSNARAWLSDRYAAQRTAQAEKLAKEYEAKERARQEERTTLLNQHRQELRAIRQQRLALHHRPTSPIQKDMTTRQELINTRVLTAITAQKMRPFSGQTVGALYFVALTQGMEAR